jgi:glutamate carboxypeptidase
MVDALERLVAAESPSTEPGVHGAMQRATTHLLKAAGFRVRNAPGRSSAGSMLAVPADRRRGRPYQLLVGHTDTVWPVGTVIDRPGRRVDGRFEGPGAFDMKAGIVQAAYAVETLRRLDRRLDVDPVILLNSDEEIGSRESTGVIRRLARGADRAFVLEPALGVEGALKTARKGIGRFTITVTGKAAHAGLEPGKGASAILELSSVIQRLFDLNDVDRGISVNVGTIEGGLRPNVVAPQSTAVVDVRVWTAADARDVESRIRALRASTPGTGIEVTGGFGRPPMEPGDGRLWELAAGVAGDLGIEVTQGRAGGASDGNTTAEHVPTLDGMGAVGGGAHAEDEFVVIEAMADRAALLAGLLEAPRLGGEE